LFSQYLKSKRRSFELYPILLAILTAWATAAILTVTGVFSAGHPSFTSMENLRNAPWFRVPYPFQWGIPQFGIAAFVGMLAGYIASMVESIGDYYACARLSGAPIPDKRIINRGITFEGIGCFVAGIFGTGNGTTSYSENIGAIGLTRVGSRRVVQAGAIIMILLGTVSKFGALFTTIPGPIVGGMYCAMFGMIAAVGLSNLQFVDLNSARNLFILGFAFFMGLSVPAWFADTMVPIADYSPALLEHFPSGSYVDFSQANVIIPGSGKVVVSRLFQESVANVVITLGSTGMAVGAFSALALDNTIPGTDEERGLTAWGAKSH
jgi:nucleobase transporter 1/2